MRKAFDIMPPRSRSGSAPAEIPVPKVERDLSALEVQPHDWHVPVPTRGPVIPIPTPDHSGKDSAGKRIFIAVKRGGMYLLVGLLSFSFFSAIFYGYNRYQDRQRTALEEQGSVSGAQTPQQESTIRILNGSGSAEQLSALQEALETKGYEARSVGSAVQASERTIIYYKGTAEAQALSLAADIGQFASSLKKNDNLVGLDDIVVLLGSLPNLGEASP